MSCVLKESNQFDYQSKPHFWSRSIMWSQNINLKKKYIENSHTLREDSTLKQQLTGLITEITTGTAKITEARDWRN
jgi:hypothetical protein